MRLNALSLSALKRELSFLNRIELLPKTFRFLELSYEVLDYPDSRWHYMRHFGRNHYEQDSLAEQAMIDDVVTEIEVLTKLASEKRKEREPIIEPISSRWQFLPTVLETIVTVPIYKEAVSLVREKLIVEQTSELLDLLYLLRVPGIKEGLDIENHGFGFHFHYGKIKKDELKRTNLLLTFDPSNQSNDNDSSLIGEYHGNSYKRIDAESIGKNRRQPIYFICREVKNKRGVENFKRPGNESFVFFSNDEITV